MPAETPMKIFVGVCFGAFAVHAFYTWIWWASCG